MLIFFHSWKKCQHYRNLYLHLQMTSRSTFTSSLPQRVQKSSFLIINPSFTKKRIFNSIEGFLFYPQTNRSPSFPTQTSYNNLHHMLCISFCLGFTAVKFHLLKFLFQIHLFYGTLFSYIFKIVGQNLFIVNPSELCSAVFRREREQTRQYLNALHIVKQIILEAFEFRY